MIDKKVISFKVGSTASQTRIVEEEDVEAYAQMCGDTNPIHLVDEYAKNSRFGKRIAHGTLIAGYISAVLGTIIPGPGSICLSQSLSFKHPTYLKDQITATVTITNIRQDKPIITLRTTCKNQEGTIVINGEAVLLAPNLSSNG